MVNVRLCIDGTNQVCEVSSPGDLRRVLEDPRSLIWIDIDPTEIEELEAYEDLIHLHPLAVEDARSPHQRPIFNRYGDTIFLVLHELIMHDDGSVRGFPISFFVGQNYVVTVRDLQRSTLDDVAARWHDFSRDLDSSTPGFMLFTIVDAIVDGYFPIIDSIGDRIEDLEEQILEPRAPVLQREIHALRKELFAIRRQLAPGREVLNEILRRDSPLLDQVAFTYFQDVLDHLLRVLDWLDGYREMAGTLFEMQLAMSSHRLDQVMRTLTVASIMLMTAALIAGIYGMNFDHMPELHWVIGYPLALGLMLLTSVALYAYFRRRRWL